MIREYAGELFAGLEGTTAAPLPKAPAVVLPVALDGGTLTVFAHPEGTASRVDQRHDQFVQALGQKGLTVERIVALDVSAAELFLARAIADLDGRLAKVEPK
jgi:hypothetical protein